MSVCCGGSGEETGGSPLPGADSNLGVQTGRAQRSVSLSHTLEARLLSAVILCPLQGAGARSVVCPWMAPGIFPVPPLYRSKEKDH